MIALIINVNNFFVNNYRKNSFNEIPKEDQSFVYVRYICSNVPLPGHRKIPYVNISCTMLEGKSQGYFFLLLGIYNSQQLFGYVTDMSHATT